MRCKVVGSLILWEIYRSSVPANAHCASATGVANGHGNFALAVPIATISRCGVGATITGAATVSGLAMRCRGVVRSCSYCRFHIKASNSHFISRAVAIDDYGRICAAAVAIICVSSAIADILGVTIGTKRATTQVMQPGHTFSVIVTVICRVAVPMAV